MNLVKNRLFLLRLKLRIAGSLSGSRQLALAQGAFYKISTDPDFAVRALSHLITSVAHTVMSTPDAERNLTKFFTTPVFMYAEETPRVSRSS